jgi:uncharacterized protein (DUF305 family)
MRMLVTAALALLMAGPALAEAPKKAASTPKQTAPKPASSDADLPFAAAIEKMNQGLPATPTGNPDRDFTSNMLAHGTGAVGLAEAELKYGKDPALKKLAQSIIDTRAKEKAALAKWRKTHPK